MTEFTCCNCKKTYLKKNDDEWNEFKAAQELLTLYPESKNDATDILCHNCNEEFLIWFNQLTDDEKQKMRE